MVYRNGFVPDLITIQTNSRRKVSIFQFQVTQEFNCTYEVEALTADEAWAILMDGEGDVVDQIPGPITSTALTSYVEEIE